MTGDSIGQPRSSQSGISSAMPRGSITAPEMPCEPISFPFSRTAIERPSSFFSLRLVVRLDQLRETVGGGQTGRSGADDDDIDVESLALDAGKFSHACSFDDHRRRFAAADADRGHAALQVAALRARAAA